MRFDGFRCFVQMHIQTRVLRKADCDCSAVPSDGCIIVYDMSPNQSPSPETPRLLVRQMEVARDISGMQCGAPIEALWSLHITITDIICAVYGSPFTFYGILTHNSGYTLDLYQTKNKLLWIYDNGAKLLV